MRNWLIAVTVSAPVLFSAGVNAARGADMNGWKFEGVYFLHYRTGETSREVAYSDFKLSRSYMTIKKEISPMVSSRITMDSHQDDTGDMKVRLKYAYGHLMFGTFGFIAKPNLEFGLVHTPWIDFEQSINRYRAQGSMFIDRLGVAPSADFGFTLGGYFGGEMDDDYKKSVNKKYAGRFGSFAVGLYNGGGYAAMENNIGKVLQARVSLRPLPDQIGGLQLNIFAVSGLSNRKDADTTADWKSTLAMLSYESSHLTFTGQYLTGGGNKSGTSNWYDGELSPYDYSGFSLFAEGKFSDWRTMVRYDQFDPNVDADDNENRLIIGAGYFIAKGSLILIDHEIAGSTASGAKKNKETKLTLSISI